MLNVSLPSLTLCSCKGAWNSKPAGPWGVAGCGFGLNEITLGTVLMRYRCVEDA